MLGDPRETILRDIEKFTLESISTNFLDTGVNTIYRSYGDLYGDCLYLIFVKDVRVLVYGMDMDKTPPADYDYLFGDDEEATSPAQEKVSLFCRCLELDSHRDVAHLLNSEDEYFLDAMQDRVPHGEDTNEDFFLRNSFWLMNPTIH